MKILSELEDVLRRLRRLQLGLAKPLEEAGRP